MPKRETDIDRMRDHDALVRQVIWIPGLGHGTGGAIMPALSDLILDIQTRGEEVPLTKAIKALAPFIDDDMIDEDTFVDALEAVPGFIIEIETPKRKWFSDGSPRINWGDTWTEWFYATDPSQFADIAVRFALEMIEEDGRRHPRIEENVAA